MALSKTITLDNDLQIPSAYLKITNVFGNKNAVDITLTIFTSKEASDNNEIRCGIKYYRFVPDVSETSPNFIKQGYEYLKTLDEYSDAIDV